MSAAMTNRKFAKDVPDNIKRTTHYLEKKYFLSLGDAFQEAIHMHMEDIRTWEEIYLAWEYEDFRAFIPQAYTPESLDFEKHPLEYEAWFRHRE